MNNLNRLQYTWLKSQWGQQKVIMIYGTRRVGKTWLLNQLQNQLIAGETLFLPGEDMAVHQLMANRTLANFQQMLAGKNCLIIDEAQYIPDIGMALKLMIDYIKPLTIFVSGSSSFDLVNKTGEPLVGRSKTVLINPVAQCELSMQENAFETLSLLPQRLVYGGYPEVLQIASTGEKEAYLKDLVTGYLLKDIFAFENLRNPQQLMKLLQLLAWQIGGEVSLNELANKLGIHKATVDRYLQMLAKVFIIFPLRAYSNNLRKEVAKSQKWYFYDNGLRNAIIGNFAPLAGRNDIGQLWEQYFISERVKCGNAIQQNTEYYFWRTYDQQEIDLVENTNGKLTAFECKYNAAKTPKPPTAFANAYPDAVFQVANQQNYLQYILTPATFIS
ncbi:ATP-binding protein [soil metagenome]